MSKLDRQTRTRHKSVTAAALATLLLGVPLVLSLVPLGSAATHSIDISGFAFSPSSITIAPGDSVTWTNHDGVTHTVTGGNGSWGSGSLTNGATYTHTFDEVGDYSYHCSIHTYMTGTVHVTASGTPTPKPNSPGLSTGVILAIVAVIVVVAIAVGFILMRNKAGQKPK